MEDVVVQLKQIKSACGMTLNTAWKDQTRSELLRHAAATKTALPVVSVNGFGRALTSLHSAFSVFVPESVLHVMRPMATFVLIVALTVSGWIASVSASYSVPGDVLYNVKIAAEKTQVAVATVAGSNEWKAQLHLKFATERAREAKEVVAKNVPESGKQVETAIDSLNKSIVAASDSIKDVSDEQPEKAVELAKDANQKTEEIVNNLNEVSIGVALGGDVDLTKKVVETTKLVNDASIANVEVVVQKQAENTVAASAQDIKDLVEKKIDTVIQAQKVAGEAIAQVQISASTTVSSSLTAVVQPLTLPDTTKTAPLVTLVPVLASSTAVIVAPPVVSQTVEQAVQKVTQTTVVVDGAVKEAKDLVQNNQLFEAIQKVKEATIATQEAKQAVVEAQQIVKDSLPVVAPVSETGATKAVESPKVSDTSTSPTPKNTNR